MTNPLNQVQAYLDRLQQRKDEREAYQRFFESHDGKIILSHILKEAGVTTPRITADRDEALVNEGMRRLAFSIVREAHAPISFLSDLITDAAKRHAEHSSEKQHG